MRVAALDQGTNTTRLLVADVVDGAVEPVERRLAITRLGEGVDTTRRLLPAAVERVRAVLAGYREAAEAHGAERALLVATSAVRDAANGGEFLAGLERDFGLATRLLSGAEEADLTFRGVTAGRPLAEGTLIVDIGGGSTELVLGGPGGIVFRTSLDVGSVRLTERFGEDAAACAAAVRALLPALAPHAAVGVAGTVTTVAALDLDLAAYDPERVHGHRIPLAGVVAQLERLAALPLEERRRVPALEPERAPVIVAGIAILRAVLEAYGLDAIEASEQDLLTGVALAAAEPG